MFKQKALVFSLIACSMTPCISGSVLGAELSQVLVDRVEYSCIENHMRVLDSSGAIPTSIPVWHGGSVVKCDGDKFTFEGKVLGGKELEAIASKALDENQKSPTGSSSLSTEIPIVDLSGTRLLNSAKAENLQHASALEAKAAGTKKYTWKELLSDWEIIAFLVLAFVVFPVFALFQIWRHGSR